MWTQNPDNYPNTTYYQSLTGIPINNPNTGLCSFGVWTWEDVYFDPQGYRSVTEEVTYWSKCLNASTYNYTSNLDNIYPGLGSQYSKTGPNSWSLPLEQGPGIGQIGHFIPDRAISQDGVNFVEVTYISYNENLNIGTITTKQTIDSKTMKVGDTVLLINQNNTKENGLYSINNQYYFVPIIVSTTEPTVFLAMAGLYNIGNMFITTTDYNGNVVTPFSFVPTDRWLVRSRTEYKTKRTFTFRHGLPHYGIVVGDNGLILDYTVPETKLVDTRWPLYYTIEDDNGMLWAVGDRGTILTSQDYGATWTNIFLDTEAGFRWMGTIGEYVVLIGERSTVYYTTNGGNSFTQVAIPRKYTKDLLSGYLEISSVTTEPILWAVGEEGAFLEIDIINQITKFHKLESDVRNEATLGQLQHIFPLASGFIILGNDIVGYYNTVTEKYCDIYPLYLSDPLVDEGEIGGRNWAGYEIIAVGAQQDIIYLFSQAGEIFSLTLTYDVYSPGSCPIPVYDLMATIDIGLSSLESVLVTDSGWLAIGTMRGLWTIDFTSFGLTEVQGIDPLFMNRFLILDYFMARKMETVVNGDDIVPTGTIPGESLTGITYLAFTGPGGTSNYFNWYQSLNPYTNNYFEARTGLSDYSLTGLTTIATPILFSPAGTELVGPAGTGIDYFNLTGLTGINAFITGSYATIFIDWVNGLGQDKAILKDILIVSNENTGSIGISSGIEEYPQLNTYASRSQLWLNPLGLYNGINFYVNMYAFGYVSTLSAISDMNIGDYVILDVITDGITIFDHGFTIKEKTLFGGADFIIFEETLPYDLIVNLNESMNFNRSVFGIKNSNRFSDDNTLDIVLANHPLGGAYAINPVNMVVSGQMTYLTSYFNLSVDITTMDIDSVVTTTSIDYSNTETTWNPGYTLLGFLSSLSTDITPDLEINGLRLNTNNSVNIPYANSYGNRILVSSNYDASIKAIFDRLDAQNQWVDLTVSNTGTTYTVLIKQMRFIEDQNWLMVLDSDIGVEFESPITIQGRSLLGQISSDLEATDDIHFKLARDSSYSSKVRLGGIASALLENPLIKTLLTAAIYVDDSSNVVISTLDISDDPNWVYRPVDVFELGSDNGCRSAIWVSNANFQQTNPDWKRDFGSGDSPTAALVNIDISRIRYRLIDSLTLQSVHDNYNWILNAHIDNGLIGQDFSNNSIVWYLGDWYCGYFEGGRWVSGNWYGGIWNSGVWESLVVEDLFNAARIIEDLYDGEASNWWGGAWKGGVFDGGTWWGGTWNDGDFIYGLWQSGTWANGTFWNGIWRGGTWYSGTFKNGKMNGRNFRTVWKNGSWTGGDFENGTWEYGTFDSSPATPSRFGTNVTQYHRAVWMAGTWKDGQFMALARDEKRGNYKTVWKWSTWMSGTWQNGHFKGGEFQAGTWENGYWMDGIFGTGAMDLTDAVWVNGHWKSGTWANGTWMAGTMEKSLWLRGDFQSGNHGLQIKRSRKLYLPKKKHRVAATINGQNRNIRSNIPNPLTQLENEPIPVAAFNSSYNWP